MAGPGTGPIVNIRKLPFETPKDEAAAAGAGGGHDLFNRNAGRFLDQHQALSQGQGQVAVVMQA